MNKTISKVTALLAALVVAVCAMPAAVSADSTTLVGSGTEKDPYVVTTAGQLKELNTKDEVGYAQLGADIDMNGVVLDNKTYVIKKLTGEFDGKGYTISNLSLEGGSGNYSYQTGVTTYVNTGLIGELAGTVKNLKVELNGIIGIDNYNCVGVLVGQISEGSTATIDNCIASGSITYTNEGSYTFVGGLVGRIYGSIYTPTTINVNNCISNVVISGARSTYCGGIIGSAQSFSNVNISNCSILGNISGSGNAGGVVGYINSGSVSLELSNTLLCAKVGAYKNFGISYNTSSNNNTVTGFYYDSTLNPSSLWSSFDMIYRGNINSNSYTSLSTTEMKSLNLEGFKVVEGEYNGYPVPVWKTSGGDEPITYSITLDDSKIKAVVSVADAGTYCVVFASYNGDTLTSVGVVKRKFDAGANQSVDAPEDFNATGATTVKAMLLRSFEDIYPLCEAAQK